MKKILEDPRVLIINCSGYCTVLPKTLFWFRSFSYWGAAGRMYLSFKKIYMCFLKELFIYVCMYVFIFREGKGWKKRGRETSMCGCLSRAPYWGPGLKPRHVPCLGIKPVTLWLAGH